jgi:hypothetical protein
MNEGVKGVVGDFEKHPTPSFISPFIRGRASKTIGFFVV